MPSAALYCRSYVLRARSVPSYVHAYEVQPFLLPLSSPPHAVSPTPGDADVAEKVLVADVVLPQTHGDGRCWP